MEDGLIVTFGLCNCSINHIQIAYEILGKQKLTTISNKFSLFDLAASKEITERMYTSDAKEGTRRRVAKTNKHGVIALCNEVRRRVFFFYDLYYAPSSPLLSASVFLNVGGALILIVRTSWHASKMYGDTY